MGYTTFGTVLQWLQDPMGQTVSDNRENIVVMANRIRQHFYLLYEKVRMFMDAEECFCIQEFVDHCDACRPRYLGITLPEHVLQAEEMKVAGVPVTMFNKWREWKAGVICRTGCRVESFDLGDGFCTERDIGCTPYKVKIMAKSARDIGKIVRVTYIDVNGKETTEEIQLDVAYRCTESEVAYFKRPGGIVFPTPLDGGAVVALADEMSTVLSEFYPGSAVVSLRRLRLSGVCHKDVVQFKGNRRYTPMYFDHDVVETDNQQAFEEMALSFKFERSQSTDPQVLQKGVFHQQQAKLYLLGEQARDEGGDAVRRLNLLGPRKSRSRLPSRRYRC